MRRRPPRPSPTRTQDEASFFSVVLAAFAFLCPLAEDDFSAHIGICFTTIVSTFGRTSQMRSVAFSRANAEKKQRLHVKKRLFHFSVPPAAYRVGLIVVTSPSKLSNEHPLPPSPLPSPPDQSVFRLDFSSMRFAFIRSVRQRRRQRRISAANVRAGKRNQFDFADSRNCTAIQSRTWLLSTTRATLAVAAAAVA